LKIVLEKQIQFELRKGTSNTLLLIEKTVLSGEQAFKRSKDEWVMTSFGDLGIEIYNAIHPSTGAAGGDKGAGLEEKLDKVLKILEKQECRVSSIKSDVWQQITQELSLTVVPTEVPIKTGTAIPPFKWHIRSEVGEKKLLEVQHMPEIKTYLEWHLKIQGARWEEIRKNTRFWSQYLGCVKVSGTGDFASINNKFPEGEIDSAVNVVVEIKPPDDNSWVANAIQAKAQLLLADSSSSSPVLQVLTDLAERVYVYWLDKSTIHTMTLSLAELRVFFKQWSASALSLWNPKEEPLAFPVTTRKRKTIDTDTAVSEKKIEFPGVRATKYDWRRAAEVLTGGVGNLEDFVNVMSPDERREWRESLAKQLISVAHPGWIQPSVTEVCHPDRNVFAFYS